MQQLPIIQSLWIGDKLSTMERLCISSFLYYGHSFHLYVYDDVIGIPDGVVVKDANEIVPSSNIFKYKEHNSYAGFSNIFRYKLLFDKGGYWVDTDNVCLQPFSSEAEYIFSSERAEGPNSNNLQLTNTGVIKVPKHSAIMEYCYNEAISKDENTLKWGEIGPKLLDSAVKKFGLQSHVASPEEFCTIDWWKWEQFIDGSVDKSILKGAKSVHLWNEMWRRSEMDKDGTFDESSLYEWFKKTYFRVDKSKESQIVRKQGMVSIVIPCFNQAEYLEESVQSAIEQTYRNIEVVIVNDGSSDNTEEIVLSLQKKYPKNIQIVIQTNMGLSEARNSGIRKALGEYILLLDADDKIDQEMIYKCMKAIIHNEADIVYTDVQCFGLNEDRHIKNIQNILYDNPPSPSSLFRRQVWETVGGFKKNMVGGYEDWEFWVNVFKHNFKFHYYPELLFFYRIKEESMYVSAKKDDLYLTAKLIMNHPELYTLHKVQKSIATIKKTEVLADFYFYSDQEILNADQLINSIASSFENIQDQKVIKVFDQKVGLCALETLDNLTNIETLYKQLDIDLLVLYAPLRYEIEGLHTFLFSWRNSTGLENISGTIFPFILRSEQEKLTLQITACEHLQKYTDYLQDDLIKRREWLKHLNNMLNKSEQLKEMGHKDEQLKIKQQMIEKQEIIIKDRGEQLKEMGHKEKQLYSLLERIEILSDNKILTNPFQKLRAYKKMLNVFFNLKKEILKEKESKKLINEILVIHGNKGIIGTEIATIMTEALVNLNDENDENAKKCFKKLENLHPGLPKQYFTMLPYLAEKILVNPKYTSEAYMYYCAAYAYDKIDYGKFFQLLSEAALKEKFSDLALYEYMELLLKRNDLQKILSEISPKKIKNMRSVLMQKAYDVYMQTHYQYFDADTAYKKCQHLQQDFGLKHLNNSSVYYLHQAVLFEEKGDIDRALKLYEKATKTDGVLHGNSLGVYTVNTKEQFSFSMPKHTIIKSAQGEGILHFAACDQLYFDKYALEFIESLPLGKRIHILIINPRVDANNEHILEKFNNVGFSYVHYEGKHLKPFYAFCRYFYIGEIASLYQTSFIVSDIDLIWERENTESLLSTNFDYSVIERTEKRIHYRWNKFTAFILGCNSPLRALELQNAAREYWDKRFLNESNIWWIDQNFLYDFFIDKKYKNIYFQIKTIAKISKK